MCHVSWANKLTSTALQLLKPTSTPPQHEAFSSMLAWSAMLVFVKSGCAGGRLAQTGFGSPTSLHQSGLSLQTTEALSLIGKSAVFGKSYLSLFGKGNVPVTLLFVITSNLNNVENPDPKDSFKPSLMCSGFSRVGRCRPVVNAVHYIPFYIGYTHCQFK